MHKTKQRFLCILNGGENFLNVFSLGLMPLHVFALLHKYRSDKEIIQMTAGTRKRAPPHQRPDGIYPFVLPLPPRINFHRKNWSKIQISLVFPLAIFYILCYNRKKSAKGVFIMKPSSPAFRQEHDSMGNVSVPADKLWGAQTQRSLENFPIGKEKMPSEIIHAFALLKRACATANRVLRPRSMTSEKCAGIALACDEIIKGQLKQHFPLSVWQTGSGTQTNMNVNEVIANRGNAILAKNLLHPNDDVNMSQSSNDTFPTAMHIAAVLSVEKELLPALDGLCATMQRLEKENDDVIKCGRTHLQDATPIRFSQEISGWRTSLQKDAEMIRTAIDSLRPLALGGTAVGTGLNAPLNFDHIVTQELSNLCGTAFCAAPNKFHALTSRDEFVFAHGAIKALACDLLKIANDIRWLASGPRLGLGEIAIPENEPGSSIMPGKVNPTQCEAITMIAVQVMGNDTTIGIAASQGNFQLNVFLPVLAYNFLQSVRLLADGMRSFDTRCVSGIVANRDKMQDNVNRSLMLVTCLTPHIGYENAARVAKTAHEQNISLKQACTALGYLTDEQFDEVFRPEQMV